jgi:hypothetical protein
VLDVLTFVVLGVLLSAGLYAAFRLGALPGQIARQRGHPQADAINAAGLWRAFHPEIGVPYRR